MLHSSPETRKHCQPGLVSTARVSAWVLLQIPQQLHVLRAFFLHYTLLLKTTPSRSSHLYVLCRNVWTLKIESSNQRINLASELLKSTDQERTAAIWLLILENQAIKRSSTLCQSNIWSRLQTFQQATYMQVTAPQSSSLTVFPPKLHTEPSSHLIPIHHPTGLGMRLYTTVLLTSWGQTVIFCFQRGSERCYHH